MKKYLLLFTIVFCSLSTPAKEPLDTIGIDQSEISKWIEEPTTNSKGNKVIKYYCLYKGFLLSTTKTTFEKVKLCNQYGARVALICIGKKVKGKFVPKRITLD